MTLTIKNPTVAKLASKLAALTGESKTEAIYKALMERSQRFYQDSVQQNHRFEMRNSLLSLSQPKNGKKYQSARLTRAEVLELLRYGPV
jgi:antitoxin VapB